MEPNIILGKSPLLETPPSKITDFSVIESVITEMVEFADKNKIVSLSANQLGFDYNVFIIKDWESYKPYCNARIVHESPELALGTETDASFPGLAVKITRPYKIRVRYNSSTGEVKSETLEGGTARLFQHEMTHMNGTYYWDDANFLNRNKAIKDWKAIERQLRKAGYI